MIEMNISSEEIKRIELDILKYIKKICDSNNLLYYLAFGSLLGAVRHQGFIPWDDDIDIWMPREDIIKLSQILDKENNTCYKMVSVYNTKGFTAPLPKIIDTRTKLVQNYSFIERVDLGVYVDVFPLDGAGNSYEEANQLYLDTHKLYVKWRRSDTKMFPPRKNKIVSFLKWIKHAPERLKGIDYWLNRIEVFTAKHSFYSDEYVGVLTNFQNVSDGNIFSKKTIGTEKYLLFENELFRVPDDYDCVLKSEYGNYMELPPIEKQKSHHKYTVEWIGEKHA